MRNSLQNESAKVMLFMQMSQLSRIVKLSNNELAPNLVQINKGSRKFGHGCKYLLT